MPLLLIRQLMRILFPGNALNWNWIDRIAHYGGSS